MSYAEMNLTDLLRNQRIYFTVGCIVNYANYVPMLVLVIVYARQLGQLASNPLNLFWVLQAIALFSTINRTFSHLIKTIQNYCYVILVSLNMSLESTSFFVYKLSMPFLNLEPLLRSPLSI